MTPWIVTLQAPLCPWDSPGKNTGVRCHSLLQGIFPTQRLNLGLLHCTQIPYHLRHQGSPNTHTHTHTHIYTFIYLLLAVLGSWLCGLFSSCSKQRLLSSSAWASHCSGFSCHRAGAQGCTDVSSYGTWAQWLQLPGSRAQAQ